MYLKSLNLKGFKSFADPTTLELEPGVTVVVGPNGSGKSNVVDAVAWVLGAQGPRVVRSQKMDDVIFAGTSKRSALGRAEVSLTIDNSSRRLPIDFNEVTITRTLFRTGESEYQLNGAVCRLLDIQELLSDSGVGRQQHVIVGQGQLDAILTARPEDRRMVIEEAAGVLKYRRRRERAERRLEASEVALARLQDLLREVRRQVKPLERQASSALRHEAIANEADALRLYLTGQELRELADRLTTLHDETASLDDEIAGDLRTLSSHDDVLRVLQEEFDANRGADLSSIIARFVRLAEHARGVGAFIGERRRARSELVSVIDDADSLVAMEDDLHRVADDLVSTESAAVALSPQWEELATAEQAHAESESEHVERFGLTEADEANLELVSVRSELANLRDELAHHRERFAGAAERRELERRIDESESERALLARTIEATGARLEGARELAQACQAKIEAADRLLTEREPHARRAEEETYAASAAVDTLKAALDELRAQAGVERLSDHDGVIGTLFDVVRVDDVATSAFEAALEGLLDSVLVEGSQQARAALAHLRSTGDAGAVIAIGVNQSAATNAASSLRSSSTPVGSTLLRDHVHASNRTVEAALDALVGEVLVVDGGFDEAIDLALSHPDRTIVTTDGHRFSPRGWRIGASGQGATRAALEEAEERLVRARAELDEATAILEVARGEQDAARNGVSSARQEVDAIDASIRRDTETLSSIEVRDAFRQDLEREIATCDELTGLIAAADVRTGDAARRLEELEQNEISKAANRSEALAARRRLEERARSLGALRRDLEVRAAALEERRSLLIARKAGLEQKITEREADRARAEVRRSAHAIEDLALKRLGSATERLVSRLEDELARLSAEQQRRSVASQERLERLSTVRRERDALERAVTTWRDRRQRLELDGTELRVRHEAAVDRLRHDLDVEPEEALVATLPSVTGDADPAARLRELERELRLLGPVNPLAREELSALQERHEFLENQLEDVRAARRELNQVIHAVDAEIVDVFAHAFSDVERHFTDLIATLFPGGSGRLELTAPDDLLNTGVEIEARPAGRNVRRLSLLSGGERSLVAVAFLFAVFRSRPSPFYILDEVEAALDEVNLLRFLDLIEEFRDEAQLVIVSHQKKTMEVADALYGISMQPGGASKAVSELLDRSKATARASRGVAATLKLASEEIETSSHEDAPDASPYAPDESSVAASGESSTEQP